MIQFDIFNCDVIWKHLWCIYDDKVTGTTIKKMLNFR